MRICTKTGLALVDGPESAFRVAKESYGPFNAQERGLLSGDRSLWYRFDTPGRTVYAAEDTETAFLVALSWVRMTAAHKDHLDPADNLAVVSLSSDLTRRVSQSAVGPSWKRQAANPSKP